MIKQSLVMLLIIISFCSFSIDMVKQQSYESKAFDFFLHLQKTPCYCNYLLLELLQFLCVEYRSSDQTFQIQEKNKNLWVLQNNFAKPNCFAQTYQSLMQCEHLYFILVNLAKHRFLIISIKFHVSFLIFTLELKLLLY